MKKNALSPKDRRELDGVVGGVFFLGMSLVIFACGVFAFTAILKVVAVVRSGVSFADRDVVLPFLSVNQVMLLAALLECAVVGFLLTRCSLDKKLASILWLCGLFLSYRMAWSSLITDPVPCPCLGSLPQQFGITPEAANALTFGILTVLIVGSSICWFFSYLSAKKRKIALGLGEASREPLSTSGAVGNISVLALGVASYFGTQFYASIAQAALRTEGTITRAVFMGEAPQRKETAAFKVIAEKERMTITVQPENHPQIEYYQFISDEYGSKSIVKYPDGPQTNVVIWGQVKGKWVATTNPGPVKPLVFGQIVASEGTVPDPTIDIVFPLWLAYGSKSFFASKEAESFSELFSVESESRRVKESPKSVWTTSDKTLFGIESYHSFLPTRNVTNESFAVTEWFSEGIQQIAKEFAFQRDSKQLQPSGMAISIRSVIICAATNRVLNDAASAAVTLPSPARVLDKRFAKAREPVPYVDYVVTNNSVPSVADVRATKQYRSALTIARTYGQTRPRASWHAILLLIFLSPLAWVGWRAWRKPHK